MTTTPSPDLRGYTLDYDAEERWLVMSDPEGASEVVARDVRPDDAAYLIAGYAALAVPAPVSEDGLRAAVLAMNHRRAEPRKGEEAYCHVCADPWPCSEYRALAATTPSVAVDAERVESCRLHPTGCPTESDASGQDAEHTHDFRDYGSRGENGRPDIRCVCGATPSTPVSAEEKP